MSRSQSQTIPSGEVEYNSDTGKYEIPYDDSVDSVTVAIADAIVALSARSVTDFPPIGSQIDCDALERLLGETPTEREGRVSISFYFEGYAITAYNDGLIEIEEPPD